MVEATFVAQVTKGYKLVPLVDLYDHDNLEFFTFKRNVLDSEDMVDKLYEIYFALIAKGYKADRNLKIDHLGQMYTDGFYLPCCDRTILAGQVDLLNDTLPQSCGVILHDKEDGYLFVSVQQEKPPRPYAAFPRSTSYRMVWMWRDKKDTTKYDMRLETNFVCVMQDGRILPIAPSEGWVDGRRVGVLGGVCGTVAVAINAVNDARHVWNIDTSEEIVGIKTPLRLGVSPEHVKSLFYARNLPITETGRKRPILHWVRAHLRRLREGIDVDISKHLRGITAFGMGGFAFRITNPNKETNK
jgi:hypothetical protein